MGKLQSDFSAVLIPSALPEQEFDEWFDNSVVTDSWGNPLVVYHSTSKDFEATDFRPLSHFGSAEAANTRSWYKRGDGERESRLFPVFLRLNNPLHIEDLVHHNPNDYASLFSDGGQKKILDDGAGKILTAKEWRYCFEEFKPKGPLSSLFDQLRKAEPDQLPFLVGREVKKSGILPPDMQSPGHIWMDRMIRILEGKGYDGFVYKNDCEDDGSKSYIAFRKEQIRPALSEPLVYKQATQYVAKNRYVRARTDKMKL